MLLENLSINGKPQGKCFAKECVKCNFYRRWRVIVDEKTGLPKEMKKCSFEVYFYTIPKLIGAIDGCQQASNESKNAVLSFGQASVDTLDVISTTLKNRKLIDADPNL